MAPKVNGVLVPPLMTLVVQTAGGLLLNTTTASVALGTVPLSQFVAIPQAPATGLIHVQVPWAGKAPALPSSISRAKNAHFGIKLPMRSAAWMQPSAQGCGMSDDLVMQILW